MADIRSSIQAIYSLEQLSGLDTCVHRRHPLVKLLSSLVFLAAVVSFGRYTLGRLIPYIFYPAVLMSLSETPWKLVLKRAALALPFALLAGFSNLLFDRAPALAIGGIVLSFGFLSFLTILYRTFLCVTAVLLLVAVTPFADLAAQLRRLHVPRILVTLFEMTYRYIGVLLEEASSLYTAYLLRAKRESGLDMRHMGSFVGQLLIRSFDRADRVYSAMKCRGYTIREFPENRRRLDAADWVYLLSICVPCILFRIFNVSALMTALTGRLL